MSKTLLEEINECLKPSNKDSQQEALIEMVDFEYLAKHHSALMMEALDREDRELMWDYLEDRIEEYAKNYWED